jgi:thiosulfate reductase cytochrome b subunit
MHAEAPLKHALPVRLLHWTNAAAIATLVATGYLIFDRINEHSAQRIHIYAAIVFATLGISYLAHLLVSGRWKLPKYQGPQRLAYTAVLLMGAGQGLTGIALYFRRSLPWLVNLLGGRHMILIEHLTLTCAILAFAAVHVIQVIRAGRPTFAAMVKG